MNQKKFKLGTSRNVQEDDRGVSPVIAVILMVAITVVMAAIVSSWSAGVKAPTTPTTVGLDIARSNKNISVVVTAIDPAGSAPIPELNISYYVYNGTSDSYSRNYTVMADVEVGASALLETNNATMKQLIITARFKDSSKKVLFSREV